MKDIFWDILDSFPVQKMVWPADETHDSRKYLLGILSLRQNAAFVWPAGQRVGTIGCAQHVTCKHYALFQRGKSLNPLRMYQHSPKRGPAHHTDGAHTSPETLCITDATSKHQDRVCCKCVSSPTPHSTGSYLLNSVCHSEGTS